MAKDTKTTKNRDNRPQGQLAQMWTVYKMTAKQDKTSVLWATLSFLLVLGAFVVFTAISFPGNVVNLVVFIIMGALFGIIAAMWFQDHIANRYRKGGITSSKSTTPRRKP